jgi:hypothetical protein
LNEVSTEFAGRRMDYNIKSVLTGQNVNALSL